MNHVDFSYCCLEPYKLDRRCKAHSGFIYVGTLQECQAEYLRQKPLNEAPKGKRDQFFKCGCLFKISRIKLHSIITEIEGATK